MGFVLAFQREAIQQGERTVEQGLEFQRLLADAWLHNTLAMGRAAQRSGTNVARQGMAAMVTAMTAPFPGEQTQAITTMDQGFEAIAEAQDQTWDAFETTVSETMDAYDDVIESQKDVLSASTGTMLDVHEHVRKRATDAAVEFERQRPERIDAGRPWAWMAQSTAPVTIPVEETVSEARGDSGDLEVISGIGSAFAERLRERGIESIEQLVEADLANLAETTGIEYGRLEGWYEQAIEMLEREG